MQPPGDLTRVLAAALHPAYDLRMNINREVLQHRCGELAAHGVYLGTSSWKYQGWMNLIYSPDRYEYRGKIAKKRFELNCLSEYAEVFKTVCVDAAYYKFPDEKYLTGLASQVPPDFRFGFKVTDAITIKKFPNLARFGDQAGKPNEHFLNADLFARAFLNPMEQIRDNVGLLMFEFSRFHPADYARGSEFVADLDRFLGALPADWPYGIEMRNRHWLQPEYFRCLAKHGVTHVFNSWDAMPPVHEQMVLPESRTTPERIGARFLLQPGRKYADAVQRFEPYNRVQEQFPEARQAGKMLIAEGINEPRRKTFIYVNNRLEGNALGTIDAMMSPDPD